MPLLFEKAECLYDSKYKKVARMNIQATFQKF